MCIYPFICQQNLYGELPCQSLSHHPWTSQGLVAGSHQYDVLIRGEKEWGLWILIRDQNHVSKSLEVEHMTWDEDNTGSVRMGLGWRKVCVGDQLESLAESLIL